MSKEINQVLSLQNNGSGASRWDLKYFRKGYADMPCHGGRTFLSSSAENPYQRASGDNRFLKVQPDFTRQTTGVDEDHMSNGKSE